MSANTKTSEGGNESASARFDPWTSTMEEALAMNGEDTGPAAPIFQWDAAQQVLAFAPPAAASGFDVLHCVALCAMRRLVMPDWLVRAFLVRYRAVQQLRVCSWDAPQAFGPPYPKGTHVAALRRRRLSRMRVALEINKFISMHPELPLDGDELVRIGKLVGEGRTRVQELQAEAVKMRLMKSPGDQRGALGFPRSPRRSRKLAGRSTKR